MHLVSKVPQVKFTQVPSKTLAICVTLNPQNIAKSGMNVEQFVRKQFEPEIHNAIQYMQSILWRQELGND